MSIVLAYPLPFPLCNYHGVHDQSGPSTFALDASGEKAGWLVQAEEDATIARLYVSCSAQSGTSPTYRIGIQGVTSGGFAPDGTYLGGGSPAYHEQQLAAGANVITLDNPIAVTKGQFFTIVIEYVSGSINGGNSATVRLAHVTFYNGAPISLTHNGTSWSRHSGAAAFFGYGTLTRWYGRPHIAIGTANPGAGAGRRAAIKFSLPKSFCEWVKVCGFMATTRPGNSSTDSWKMGIWSGLTELQATTIESEYSAAVNVANQPRLWLFADPLATLYAGQEYYIGFESIGAVAPNFSIYTHTDASLRAAYAPYVTGSASYVSPTWTDVAANAPGDLTLLLSEIELPKRQNAWRGGIRPAAFAPGSAR